MASPKTIRVNLTLNDEGFTTKVTEANGKITELNKTFKGAAKAAESMESNLKQIRDASKAANSALSSASKTFLGVKSSMSALGETARGMRKDLNSIATNTDAVVGKFRGLSGSASGLSKAFKSVAAQTVSAANNFARMDAATIRAVQRVREVGQAARLTAGDLRAMQASVTNLSNNTSRIDASVARANKAIAEFASQLKQLNRATSQASIGQASMQQMVIKTGGGFHSWVTSIGLAKHALLNLYDVFLRAPVGIIQTNAELERMQKLFEGMSTAKTLDARRKEGENTKRSIMNMSLEMPFDVKTLTDAAVKLKSAGIDPLNGSLKTLADSVAYFGGTSEQFKRAAVAIQQMAGKGVVSMEELRQQLGEAVPTAMRMMAAGMGMTMSELSNAVSKGTVEAKTAIAKMFAQMQFEMGGSAKNMMATWSGMWEGFKSRVVLFQEEIGKSGFFKSVQAQLAATLEAFDNGKVRGIAQNIGDSLTSIFRFMQTNVANLSPLLADLSNVLHLAGAAASVAGEGLSLLTAGVGGLSQYVPILSAALSLMVGRMVASKAAAIGQSSAFGALRASIAQVTASYHSYMGAMNAANIAGNATSGLQMALQRAFASTGAAVTAVGVAIRGLGAVFTALGGWIGLITAALTLGISKWMSWGQAAEDAARRAAQAKRGYADAWQSKDEETTAKGNLQDEKANVARTTQNIARLKQELAAEKSLERQNMLRAQLAQQQSEQVRSLKAVKDLTDQIRLADHATKTLEENQARAAYDQEIKRIRDKHRLDADLARKNLVEGDAYKKMSAEARMKANAEIARKQTEAEIRDIEAYGKTLGSGNRVAQLAVNDAVKGIRDEATPAIKALEVPNVFTAPKKGKKKPKPGIQDDKDSMVSFIEGAKGDAKAARVQLENLLNDVKGVASLRGKVSAELERDFLEGKYDKAINIRAGRKDNVALSVEERAAAFKKYGAELVDAKVKAEQASQTLKLFENVNDKLADAERDAKEALSELNGASKETGAIEKMRSTFMESARAIGMTGENLDKLKTQLESVAAAMARADLARITKDLRKKNEETETDRIPDAAARAKAKYDRDVKRINDEVGDRVAELQRDAANDPQSATLIADAKAQAERAIALRTQEYATEAGGALAKLAQDWQDYSGNMSQATASFASGAAEGLAELAVSGKANFADLAQSLVKDIIRINLQLMISKMLMSAMGWAAPGAGAGAGAAAAPVASALGNVFNGGRVQAFAKGGAFTNSIAQAPTLAPMALFGEAGPEAIMPLSRDGNGRLGVTVHGGMPVEQQRPSVVVNVINQSGNEVNAEHGQPRFDGEKLILDVVLKGMTRAGSFRDSMRSAMA
ncbi:tape measure protein [Chromobacterium sp. ASV23]|uniref:tape measure protein n=1 Tax=Chromobacterium sp. ASV23 TaxID=2795110 RepID=UPI0018ED11A5|nr:tape measure protein [Chromobacterium sp. ASV23]